jgi:hypothetical protein
MRTRALFTVRTALLGLVTALLYVAPLARADAPVAPTAPVAPAVPSAPRQRTLTTAQTSIAAPSTATPPAPSETDAPVGRARDLLARARLLVESAGSVEKLAVDRSKALPALRLAATAARERAARSDASRPDHEAVVARAEELEAELAVDEVDVAVKRHAAAESRRIARELRVLAVRIVKEPPALAESVAATPCDPPYRFTNDGRKIYRVECF